MVAATKDNGNITPEQFTLKAIKSLRKEGYKGIHSVYSGFNAAFRLQFPKLDVVATTKDLAAKGKLVTIPTRGGAMLYSPDDAPENVQPGEAALKKILG